jgi:hypothetical protein
MGNSAVDLFVVPALSGGERSEDVGSYLMYLEAAVASEPPPFFAAEYGESFRAQVGNPVWVIQSLISNAIKEGEGSRDLALIADSCASAGLYSDLAEHVTDEAKHCRMYVSLIDTVFPTAVPDHVREAIVSKYPPARYSRQPGTQIGDWKLLDYLIQINLGEIRTRLHQKLMEPVLEAYCPDDNKDRLCSTLCALASDECCHIRYTASRIGALAREFRSIDVQALFSRRVEEFNLYTLRELGDQEKGPIAAPLIRNR